MATVTVIGRGAHVTGRVTGAVDLEIHGRIDGDIVIGGEATIEAEGLVASNVSARRLTVRGAVKGDLTAEEAIVLENGARVVGDIRAPRIAIAKGALVRGHVQTGDAPGASSASRARAQATAPRAAAKPAAVPKPAPKAVAKPAQAQTRPQSVSAPQAARPAAAPANAVLAGGAPPRRTEAQRPPAPVVPVLKKGAKGALKKKAG
jgi:cytoskeletal protein CcmA (bactofilin family)